MDEKNEIIKKFLTLEKLFNDIKQWYECKTNFNIEKMNNRYNKIYEYKNNINVNIYDNIINIIIDENDIKFLNMKKLIYEISKIIYDEKNKI